MFFQQLHQKCVVRQQLRREQESPLEDHKLCPENKQTKKNVPLWKSLSALAASAEQPGSSRTLPTH